MALFMVVLISLGGIRAYEEMDTIQSQTLNDGYTSITAYPTSDLFTWKVVESYGGSRYRYYTFNNLKKENFTEVKEVKKTHYPKWIIFRCPKGYKYADSLPEVRKFKWNSYYTIINADQKSENWIITYSDFMGFWGPNNITVTVP